MQSIVNNIFSVNGQSFLDTALKVFRYQYENNAVYKKWVKALQIEVNEIDSLEKIPFLPIQFFKSHKVVAGDFIPEATFESSGTTGNINSSHFVKEVEIYVSSFLKTFQQFYGDADDWCIIGLLPSYLERKGSSLVMMVDRLIKLSNNPLSGFYLNEFEKLSATIQQLEARQQKTLVIGVTFALLDFAEQFSCMKLQYTTIMETGGMKGRRKEMIRDEVHNLLKTKFNVTAIHSEYGMTELLSQAYAKNDGIFQPTPWMKVLIRDEEDPLKVSVTGRGALNIIDLANIYSCSFIATEDAGECFENNTFVVNGRIDNSDIRGCSLMYK